MKTLIRNFNLMISGIAIIAQFMALIMVLATSCNGQLKIERNQITLHADTMEVRQAFALLHYMIPKGQKIAKIVIKDGVEYRQSRWLINRMLKRYAYVNGWRLRRI